jgi:hypothetical protein
VTVETPAQQRSSAQAGHVIYDSSDKSVHVTVQVNAANDGGDPKLMGDRVAREVHDRLRRMGVA